MVIYFLCKLCFFFGGLSLFCFGDSLLVVLAAVPEDRLDPCLKSFGQTNPQ